MPTAKEEALAALARLPDDATFEDMRHRLHELERARSGGEGAAAPGGQPDSEARAQLARWLRG